MIYFIHYFYYGLDHRLYKKAQMQNYEILTPLLDNRLPDLSHKAGYGPARGAKMLNPPLL